MEFILLLLLSRLLGSESVKKVVAILQGLRKGGVLRLKKAVYGLKQAPREWWKMLHAFLLSLGFRPNRADYIYLVDSLYCCCYMLMIF